MSLETMTNNGLVNTGFGNRPNPPNLVIGRKKVYLRNCKSSGVEGSRLGRQGDTLLGEETSSRRSVQLKNREFSRGTAREPVRVVCLFRR
jgi:hypothetical protein